MRACWLLLGLPLWAGISLYGGSLWLPFPVSGDESPSYYIAWLISVALIYGLPSGIVASVLRERSRHSH